MNEAQRDVWTAIQFDPAISLNYNLAVSLHLTGELDVQALTSAVQRLTDRHEALRARVNPDGETLQISAQVAVELATHDLRHLSSEAQQAAINQLKLDEVNTPFDLMQGPLCRFKLAALAGDSHLLFMTCHHIIADGWSMGVLADNLGQLYTAVCQNQPPQLPLPMQMSQYNTLLETAVGSADYQEAEQYWLTEFKDKVPVLDLPTDRPRPAQKTSKSLQIDVPFNDALIQQLNKLARAQRTTLYAYLLGAFHTLLHRYSGQKEVVVGIPVAGQLSVGEEGLVGHCVNFLPIQLNFSANPAFKALLGDVRQKLFDGIAHQAYPSGELIKKLPLKRDRSRLPLISVAFNLFPTREIEGFHKLAATFDVLPRTYELFDIFMNVIQEPGGYKIQCTANCDLFDQDTIARLIESYITLIEASLDEGETPVDRLPLLSPNRRQQIVYEWNETRMPYNRSATIHSLFEAQVAQAGDKTAVLSPTGTLSYRELNQKAEQVAAFLRQQGVQPDQFVGICLNRTPDLLVGLLGILKAGAAYLPLDPTYPTERLSFMLADGQASLLLTESSIVSQLPHFEGQMILLDSDWPEISVAVNNNAVSAQSHHLAYIIHTSGSTGRPKGVKVTHQNVVNFLHSMQQKPGIQATDVLLALTTLSFDIAVLELFLPLVSGATVLLLAKETAVEGLEIEKAINQYQVTMMQATPATWQLLLASGWQPPARLKMLSGGEAMPRKMAQQLLSNGNPLWNMYGPTETTIWSSVAQIEDPDHIVIGTPIGNTQMYILDHNLNPVPIGVTGKLWIGGDGVTQGYHNRPELTAERFITNPFVGEDARMYDTGDLARYLADGSIICLGRVDFQVKIRGFRIELGEIEAALTAHEAIKDAVVNAVNLGDGDNRLVAYLLWPDREAPLETAVLRHYLQTKLPAYMVPSNFVSLTHFPQTPNGKVDRLSLPNPLANGIEKVIFVPPQTPTEKDVAAIWAEHLKLEKVSVQADFFELGGHSLMASRIVARIRDQYDVSLTLATFFEAPTVTDFATLLDAARWTTKVQTASLESMETETEEFEF